ncbi:MAG TPA: hypothetical protein PKD55_05185 [Bellilinea sp.]|nr:hypothetical protein [Bellilinea sp.]
MPENELVELEKVVEPVTENSTPESSKKGLWIAIAVAVILVAGLVAGIILLANAPADTTAKVRDIFIIFMALTSLIFTAAIVVLIIQVAALINLLQNEIKPILHTTQDTLNNVKGTTQFMTNNLVAPVIKMNEYAAGAKKFFETLRFIKR